MNARTREHRNNMALLDRLFTEAFGPTGTGRFKDHESAIARCQVCGHEWDEIDVAKCRAPKAHLKCPNGCEPQS